MRGTQAGSASHALLLLTLLCLALPAHGGERLPSVQSDVPAPVPGSITTTPSELVFLPAFPGAKALRLRIQNEVLPGAGLDDDGAVDRFRLGIQARGGLVPTKRLTLQATLRYASTHYGFDGVQDFFDGIRTRSSDPFGPFHDVSASLQSAFVLNPHDHLFLAQEEWSLLGELFGASRWEGDALGGGVLGGGGLAVGYELPNRLQLALGVSLRSKLAENSLGVDPVFSLRWRITKSLTLRTRGRGGELEYEWSGRFRSSLSVFRSGQSWRLEKRRGVPGSSIWSDQQLRASVGFEWRPHRQLRIQLETGAIVTRTLEVETRGRGSLSQIDGDPSAFLVIGVSLLP